MPDSDSALTRVADQPHALARDLATWLGFSAAVAVTAGLIKTPMQLPGHSALFWIPVLVLAGVSRRPGMALGAALCGGLAAASWRGVDALGLAALLAAAAPIEALGLGGSARARGLRMVVAGMLGHLGKLGVKVIATLAAGLPLNEARLPLIATVAIYVAFGVAGGLIAWGALTAWLRLRGAQSEA